MANRHRITYGSPSQVTGQVYRQYLGWKARSYTLEALKDTYDEVGEWEQDNPFCTTGQLRVVPLLNGERWQYGVLREKFLDAPITYVPAIPNALLHLQLPANEQADAIRRGAVRSSPEKESVSIPTFVGELKDFPEMFCRFWGDRLRRLDLPPKVRNAKPLEFSRRGYIPERYWPKVPGGAGSFGEAADAAKGFFPPLLKRSASANLAWRFGLAPFISDLLKLAKFTDAVRRRVALLSKLQSLGRYRKRVRLGSDSWTATVATDIVLESNSTSSIIRGDVFDRWVCTRWATYEWTLDPGASLPKEPRGLDQLARRLLTGCTVGGFMKAAWDLTPWSWFADWFVGIGDFLDLHKNGIPVHLKRVNYMQTTVAKRLVVVRSCPSWISVDYRDPNVVVVAQSGDRATYSSGGPPQVDGYGAVQVVKQRLPINPLLIDLPPLPVLPGLTAGQWSILGSLVATRAL